MNIGDTVIVSTHPDLGAGTLIQPASFDRWLVRFPRGREIVFFETLLVLDARAQKRQQRIQKRQQNQQMAEGILRIMSDGQEHCLRDIGSALNYTYITGLSAFMRALRPGFAKLGWIMPEGRPGTPEESTWYRLVRSTLTTEEGAPLE